MSVQNLGEVDVRRQQRVETMVNSQALVNDRVGQHAIQTQHKEGQDEDEAERDTNDLRVQAVRMTAKVQRVKGRTLMSWKWQSRRTTRL